MLEMKVAKCMYHEWEEEPISGISEGYKGTFAVFFYGCTMKCVFCQNSKISRYKPKSNIVINEDSIYTPSELSNDIIKAEKEGAKTISFITGVLYVDGIVETIKLAKDKGLTIPIVYNSSAYENVANIKKLNGLIDIYLPDFKYYDNSLGQKYSFVPNYVDVAKLCIDEMYRQVSDKLIVRHLVLPSHTGDSKNAIRYLYDTYKDNIYISILSQYTPMFDNCNLKDFPELTRKLTKREYNKIVNYAMSLGIKNAYVQDLSAAKNIYIPDF